MSLNDFNIPPCHSLANGCQFSVMTRPIGHSFQPSSDPGAMMSDISVNLHSKAWREHLQRWYLDFYLDISSSVIMSVNDDIYLIYIL